MGVIKGGGTPLRNVKIALWQHVGILGEVRHWKTRIVIQILHCWKVDVNASYAYDVDIKEWGETNMTIVK